MKIHEDHHCHSLRLPYLSTCFSSLLFFKLSPVFQSDLWSSFASTIKQAGIIMEGKRHTLCLLLERVQKDWDSRELSTVSGIQQVCSSWQLLLLLLLYFFLLPVRFIALTMVAKSPSAWTRVVGCKRWITVVPAS